MTKQKIDSLKKANLKFANILSFATIVFACALFLLAFANRNNLVKVFGFELNVVKSGSMSPKLNKFDFVITYKADPSTIKQNDVIVFFDDSGLYKILHRVKEVIVEDEKKYFITKGDANKFADAGKRSSEDLYSKLSFKIPYIGLFFVFIASPQGFSILVVNACNLFFMSMVWQEEKQEKTIAIKQGFVEVKRKELKQIKSAVFVFEK